MKKTMLRVFLLILVCAMSLSLAACGGKNETKPEGGEQTVEGGEQTVEGVDFSLYPEKFEDWNIANLKSYLRETGVFTKNDWIFDMSAGDLEAVGAAAGTMYVDTTGGSVMDIIMYLDPTTETGAALLDGVRKDHALTPNTADAEPTPMDALLGNFCLTYTMGSDANHNAALVKALHELADHYGITPDFIAE